MRRRFPLETPANRLIRQYSETRGADRAAPLLVSRAGSPPGSPRPVGRAWARGSKPSRRRGAAPTAACRSRRARSPRRRGARGPRRPARRRALRPSAPRGGRGTGIGAQLRARMLPPTAEGRVRRKHTTPRLELAFAARRTNGDAFGPRLLFVEVSQRHCHPGPLDPGGPEPGRSSRPSMSSGADCGRVHQKNGWSSRPAETVSTRERATPLNIGERRPVE